MDAALEKLRCTGSVFGVPKVQIRAQHERISQAKGQSAKTGFSGARGRAGGRGARGAHGAAPQGVCRNKPARSRGGLTGRAALE